jgi:prevent-host-death family protein
VERVKLVRYFNQCDTWSLVMITVGAFEAKTHLSNLLERVAEGEEVIITKHGKPVARLVSALQIDRERVNQAFEKLKLLRKQTTLGGLSWQALRDAGRR